MAFVYGLVVGLVVGAGLTWGFRGWIQHRKDAAAAKMKAVGGALR